VFDCLLIALFVWLKQNSELLDGDSRGARRELSGVASRGVWTGGIAGLAPLRSVLNNIHTPHIWP
jgi:hypothetical protein